LWGKDGDEYSRHERSIVWGLTSQIEKIRIKPKQCEEINFLEIKSKRVLLGAFSHTVFSY
jgi:hypothetical protein